MNPILFAILLLGTFTPHDFFVSILTIRHVPTTRSLDLTWRMTAHDVEHALENVASLKLSSAHEHPKADSLLFAYVSEHLGLRMQERKLEPRWLGHELDGETLYCYLQVTDVDTLDSLSLTNTLLQDLFYEQQNLVHLEADGRNTLSHTFILGSTPYTFVW